MKISTLLIILLNSFGLFLISDARLFKAARNFGDWNIQEEVLDRNLPVNFKLALFPVNIGFIEQEILDRSNPSSNNFRHYLSESDLNKLTTPKRENIDKLIAWLAINDIKIVENHFNSDWLKVEASVKVIEKLFSCKLQRFKNRKNLSTKIATNTSYKIPDDISDVVQLVAGMNSFSSARFVSVAAKPQESDNFTAGIPSAVTPETIYTVYGVDSSKEEKLGSQAVVEFGNLANFNENDLQAFFRAYQQDLLGQTCGVAYGINNGDIRASVEANLDVQYIMATGVYVNTTTYKITSSARGESIEDEFLDYAYIVNNQTSPALVHSISYGEYGGSYDNETDHRFSYELMKMGLRGISVLLASGDNGVGCNTLGTEQEFDYPDSPYITM